MIKRCGTCGTEKPMSDFPKHRTDASGYYANCRACKSLEAKRYRASNIKKVRQRSLDWNRKNQEKARSNGAKWRDKNAEKRIEDWKRWAANNRDKRAEYRRLNSARSLAHTRARQARKLMATPKWATPFFMEEAYVLAKLRTKMLGYQWDVDHIVPLKSSLVCGLHVEYNLQVIPEIENLKKGNRWWPDMPDDRSPVINCAIL